jgi:drug/metabolite transporter (DMT)-like permease
VKILVHVMVAVLTLWAICAVGLNFLGIDLYWPLYVADEEPIPHHRLLTARNGVFLTFAYYGLMFLWNSFEKVSPVHFLKVYLLMTTIAGALVYTKLEIYALNEVLSLAGLLACALVIHLGSKLNYRRYFTGDSDEPL